ncbi:MAG: membrane dipeptidase [Gemmatimonadetes bacterium]|nr:membrane dipeptidase [Gemmatimonadota bacterium]MDE3256965.1 membrane dipeptidase [Gemmatimonadota bacterium]
MTFRPRQVYDDALVIDGLSVCNWNSDAVFRQLRAGNFTAINATVSTWENFIQTMAHLTAWMRRFRERDDILQVKSTADIRAAKQQDRTGIILGFQNASPIENELDRLGLFLALGVRVIQLTYHETNLLGSGCWERNDAGLSNFGVDAVKEMNRLGILIDLSHVGPQTTLDAIEMSEKPVAITHANARSFCDHPRNKEEEALKRLAEKGGVVGATSYTPFLPNGYETTVEDFVDAIDDMVERIGIDHVAIGTDSTHDQPLEFWHFIASQQGTKFPSTFADGSIPYTEVSFQPKGMATLAEFPNVADGLANRGYNAGEITKLLGGNWIRLFEQVWNE